MRSCKPFSVVLFTEVRMKSAIGVYINLMCRTRITEVNCVLPRETISPCHIIHTFNPEP